MYKKINQVYFIADTKDDLALIPDPKMNDECFVIQDACEYKAMSTGEWVKQVPPVSSSTSSEGSSEIDLSTYATIEYVDGRFAEDEDAPAWDTIASKEDVRSAVNGLASEQYVKDAIAANNSIKDVYGDAHAFGLMVDSSDNKTLVEAMLEKGKVGMYNFHVEKGSPGQPDAVVEKNSSCRGIACVDTYRSDTNWYGWILMFDHDGEVYTQYIRNAEPKGWKKLATV